MIRTLIALAILLLIHEARAEESVLATKATQVLKELTQGASSGVAVLVAQDGQIKFQGGFGFADIEQKIPITVDTKFRIGSVSKQFTAAAVLRLVEQNKLSLDGKLSEHFAGFPGGDQITLHQLLTHTSGLKSYTEKADFYARVTKPVEPTELLEYFRKDPPDFAPGEKFHYNNSAYFLLGEIVAKVSGKPLDEYLRVTFFEPLGMKNTGVLVNRNPPENMAKGYSYTDGKFELALDWDMSWAGGAGALYSTVGDLYLWNEAFYSGKVVNEESFKRATTPVKMAEKADGMNYGYGLLMYQIKRLPVIGHGGGLNGWSSDLLRVPEQKCTVVVLSNALPPPPQLQPQSLSHTLVVKSLAEDISKLPPLKEDPSIDPKSFVDYVGRYDYQGAVMTVTVDNKTLFAQLTGQEKLAIYPKAKDEFFWKVVDAEVTFLRDEKGDVIAARHSQSGNVFTAPKLKVTGPQLSEKDLESYVGQYQYAPGVNLNVTRERDQLYAQLPSQPKFPIFHVSESQFEWRVVAAKVKFIKDDEGKVVKAVHEQNGQTINAPRVD